MKISNLILENSSTVDALAPLTEVSHAMHDHSVGIVPVTKAGHLVGVVTHQDLESNTRATGYRSRPLLAQDIMTTHSVVVSPESNIESAVAAMKRFNVTHLIIAAAEESIRGAVSLQDIKRQSPKFLEHDGSLASELQMKNQSGGEQFIPGLYLG